MKGLVLSLVALGLLSGCAKNTLEISKCSKYDKGVCVTENVRTVHLCNNPTMIGKAIYCDK